MTDQHQTLTKSLTAEELDELVHKSPALARLVEQRDTAERAMAWAWRRIAELTDEVTESHEERRRLKEERSELQAEITKWHAIKDLTDQILSRMGQEMCHVAAKEDSVRYELKHTKASLADAERRIQELRGEIVRCAGPCHLDHHRVETEEVVSKIGRLLTEMNVCSGTRHPTEEQWRIMLESLEEARIAWYRALAVHDG